MIYRGENYISDGYPSSMPKKDMRRYGLLMSNSSAGYYFGGIDQQTRRAGMPVTRYVRPNVAGNQTYYTQVSHAEIDTIVSYWQNVLSIDPDNEISGAFVHTGSPTSSANRKTYPNESALTCIRFASSRMLEFLYGADASGIRSTDGQPGDFITRILWEPTVKYLFMDTFITYTNWDPTGNSDEEQAYKTVTNYGNSFYTTIKTLRERVCKPRGLQLVVNAGSVTLYPGENASYGKPIGDHIADDLFDVFYKENLGDKTYPWWSANCWDGSILRNLITWRMLFAAGKAVMGESRLLWSFNRFGIWYTGSASPKTYAYNPTNKRLTITLGTNVFNYDITSSSSWNDIKSFLQNCKDPNDIYLQVSEPDLDKLNWDAVSPYIYMYHYIPSTTISASSSNPSYIKLHQTPRESLVTLAAALLLAAPGQNNSRAYIVGNTSVAFFYDCDLFDAFPLLGQPDFVNQPLGTVQISGYNFSRSWDQVNAGWGDVYYRLFSNGVAFLNWTDTDREISANDARWGSRNAWYPMAQRVEGDYNVFVHPTDKRTQSVSSVTVKAKSGEICLFEA